MSRVTQVFRPVEKGKYWRTIYNLIKDSPPFSVELMAKVLDGHPRQSNGEFELPYTQLSKDIDYSSNPADLTVPASFANDLLHEHFGQIKKSLKAVASKAKSYPHGFYEPLHIPSQLRPLVDSCLRLDRKRPLDHRHKDDKIKELWHLGGLSDWVRDFEKLWFAHLGLSISIDELEVPYIDRVDSVYTDSPTNRAVEWVLATFADNSVMTPPDKKRLSLFVDSLKVCTAAAIPLGELEILRRLALNTWSNSAESSTLTASEVLSLHKYVQMGTVELELDNDMACGIRPQDISAKSTYASQDATLNLYLLNQAPLRHYGMLIVMNAFLDFWNELNYYNRFESYKGTFECIECGMLIPRSFDGYGQKYCSDQCKKRAAKKRYLLKKKLGQRILK